MFDVDKITQRIQNNNIINITNQFLDVDNEDRYIRHIPTGLRELDEKMEGGLTPGFTILGAQSSLGKSTLEFQIAFNLLKAGNRVLIFSLEMSKQQIISKMISLASYENYRTDNTKWYFSANESFNPEYMRNLKAGSHFTDYEDAVNAVTNSFSQLDNQFDVITPRTHQITADEIEQYVTEYMKVYPGEKPIVFVDYLQILGNEKPNSSDLDKLKYDVNKLHMLAMREDLVVFTICSFNRASYNKAADMSALNGGSVIEYSADTILYINFAGAGEEGFDAKAAKAKEERDMEIYIDKQRMGRTGISVPCKFITKANYFEFDLPEEEDLINDTAEEELITTNDEINNIVPMILHSLNEDTIEVVTDEEIDDRAVLPFDDQSFDMK